MIRCPSKEQRNFSGIAFDEIWPLPFSAFQQCNKIYSNLFANDNDSLDSHIQSNPNEKYIAAFNLASDFVVVGGVMFTFSSSLFLFSYRMCWFVPSK